MARTSRKFRITAGILFGVVAGMIGLSFASVPLYRKFCQLTGYGGTPKTENVARSQAVSEDEVTVQFDANVDPSLPWRFTPEQRRVRVHLGEETLVHFRAVNLSDRPLTGQATYNVVPDKAAPYFNKIQCFCFNEQTLQPKQSVSMPVLFYVDPALAQDVDARDAKTITLSYTFFLATDSSPGSAATKGSTGAGS